jgi:small subunit ribosomal protein S9
MFRLLVREVRAFKWSRWTTSLASEAAQEGVATRDPTTPTYRTEPTQEELENEEVWMQEEIKDYYRGRNRLAIMMGRDPSTFSDKDVEEAIRYLLPSSLTAKDARPFMKHPSLIYPKRIASSFGPNGRPLQTYFYTGSPAYHNLISEIYVQQKILESFDSIPVPHQTSATPTEIKWITQERISNKLAEEVNDDQYGHLIERLNSLANHPQSHQIKDFLDKYRAPVFDYRSQAKIPQLNPKGYSYAVGRRKTSSACVWLSRGSGHITINKKPLIQYFPRLEDRQQILYPFIIIDQLGQYDVSAAIRGGGTTGKRLISLLEKLNSDENVAIQNFLNHMFY